MIDKKRIRKRTNEIDDNGYIEPNPNGQKYPSDFKEPNPITPEHVQGFVCGVLFMIFLIAVYVRI
ncbi:MAG: hypothetical protein EOS54_09560 [Mesorhizobium sp.]|uniref:hypothetical protein n=1 Tax=unclassified Mesorhizobium TaxID=325217 RepID=UPI000F752926|nr:MULTISPECIES: hypothetical protein [unclassified Mesorhizobium]AZO46904.1 hypothetical protein EJ073_03060 [Mesorhizobium sp. M4B.F.Ca.ET.058.02.1.1]RWC54909.1 MAG: hypothetical protein EOS54_09560 [Mesorhizobium sp.]TIU63932.1 MAG: hypothetical protein E5W30_03630 [Mesorhizobium sp.]TIU71228.1 MAG: hypothetical protein E5W25_04690 [Mesorhizobium sp.]TIV82144.1 MAG: hypothetical protein E5V64_13285 [Mesorhizobium sp.]